MRKRLVALVALVGIVAMMGCGFYTAGVARAAALYRTLRFFNSTRGGGGRRAGRTLCFV